MKKLRFFAAFAAISLFVLPLTAEQVTLHWGGESLIIDSAASGSADLTGVPLDIINIVKDHQHEIEAALLSNNVSQSDAITAATQAKDAYSGFLGNSGITNPYTATRDGLNNFAGVISDVIPNSQIQQNVWANAWIGMILPAPKFGFGINTGLSKLDLTPLVSVAEALDIKNNSDLPNTLVWPTITADVRVGGFLLPFDVGLTAMTIDTSKISMLGDAVDPAYFDFFTVGGDIRYAFLEGGVLRPKLSLGLGAYYTKGKFGVEDEGSSAELEFDTTSVVVSAQASIKLLIFVPFVGGRMMFSKSNTDWRVHANWASILGTTGSDIADAVIYGFLPADFTGGDKTSFSDHIRPVIFGGCALDLGFIDFTVSGSYDLISDIPSGAVSLRIALN